MEQKRREKNITILEWFDAVLFSVIVVLLVYLIFIRMVTVDGYSMEPTLEDGDQIVLSGFLYKPSRGDVVVADAHISLGIPIVKRVIAIGGDIVDIDFESGSVFVNGEEIVEDYISDLTKRAYDVTFPLEVPQGMVFLLGDNRPLSKDSRHSDIGLIDERDILGRVFYRITPFRRMGKIT